MPTAAEAEEEDGACGQAKLEAIFATAGLPSAEYARAAERQRLLTSAQLPPPPPTAGGGRGAAGGGAERAGSAKREWCRTVEEELREGGWRFVRRRTHIVFKRTHEGTGRTQTFVQSSTPSARRTGRAELGTLHRLDELEAASAAAHAADADAQPADGGPSLPAAK